MLKFTMLDPKVTDEHLGFIPYFMLEDDVRPAIDQINERYAHGGGWRDLDVGDKGFTLSPDGELKYPGDPKMKPYAEASLHGGNSEPGATGEHIIIYESGFVAVVQVDGSFRVARLD